MGKGRGQHTNVIKGPIGEGVKLNLQRNQDGSLNYSLAAKEYQAEKMKAVRNVSKLNTVPVTKGESYISQYVRELRSGIENIQNQKKEQQQRFADRVPIRNFSKSEDFSSRYKNAESKTITKQPDKNEPTIDR